MLTALTIKKTVFKYAYFNGNTCSICVDGVQFTLNVLYDLVCISYSSLVTTGLIFRESFKLENLAKGRERWKQLLVEKGSKKKTHKKKKMTLKKEEFDKIH